MISTCSVAISLAFAALLVAFAGCSEEQLEQIGTGKGPSVTGTWVGRIEKVTVYDPDRNPSEAALLNIERGPAPPELYPGADKGVTLIYLRSTGAKNGDEVNSPCPSSSTSPPNPPSPAFAAPGSRAQGRRSKIFPAWCSRCR
jgi:hypothetical protein